MIFFTKYDDAHRYSFTVFSNILVYVVTWIVLRSNNANKTQFGPSERKEFQVSIVFDVPAT
jgi:hypothetical protein